MCPQFVNNIGIHNTPMVKESKLVKERLFGLECKMA